MDSLICTFPFAKAPISQSRDEPSCKNDSAVVYGYLIRIDQNDAPTHTYEINKTKIMIGRRRSNDILLTENTISSRHCEIGM